MNTKDYSAEEISMANKTSRGSKAIGEKAIVPRMVITYIKPGVSVLDFGAGKQAIHTKRLRDAGYDVTAYEFGENVVEGIHDPQALSRTYAVVYASNVLNVQSSLKMLDNTVLDIKKVMKDTGVFIANYPLSPRKIDLDGKQMITYLKLHFSSVDIIHGNQTQPVLLLKK